MATSSARPDDLDAFVRGSRAADDELRGDVARLRAAYADFQDGTRWGHLDATSLINALGRYVDLNEADARWVAQIAQAFRAAGGDGDLSRLPDAAIAASLRAAGLTGGRTAVTFDDPVAYGFPPTSGFADDPVNTASGNFLIAAADLPQWRRVYNSRSDVAGAFGPGWSSWAGTRLHARPEGAEYSGPDGQRAVFPRQGAGYGRVLGIAAEVTPRDDGLELRWFDGRVWTFDGAGRIRSADRLVFGYDAAGRLETAGRTTLTWADDRIVSAVGAGGRRVDYSYAGGVLVTAGDTRYEVDDRSRVVAVVDADGVAEARNTYDDHGRVLTQTSRFGLVTRYAYLPGRVTVTGDQDFAGVTNTYTHDDHGRLLSVVDGHGNRLSRTYDAWGNPVTVTDRNGAVTTMRWDEKGRLLRQGLFGYRYDDAGRLTEVSASTRGTVRYRYDRDERTPSEITDAEGGSTRLDVRDGLVLRVTDPDGVTFTFGYDDDRDLVTATDGLGNVTRVERDAAGRVAAVVTALGRRTAFEYDGRGRLAARQDPDGGRWQYEYTAAGRQTAVMDPAGARHEIRYGDHGEPETITDPLGAVATRQYDGYGNLARIVAANGAKWDFGHDALSRVTSVTDPAGATWLREYDAAGNLIATVDPAGARYAANFDEAGRVTGLHDGLTSATFEYDPLGRATAQIRPDGIAARAGYDRCGRRTSVVEPDGGVSRFGYTPGGRLSRAVSPAGRTTVYEYDECGRLAARTDGAGRRWEFRYDADGLLTERTGPDGARERLEYDANGRLVRRGRHRVEYDAAGRPVAVTSPATGARRFRYDPAGRLTEAADALGNTTRYEYDPHSRVSRVVDPEGGVTTRRYDEAGRLVAQTDPLGRTTTLEYDQAGRLRTRIDASGRRVRWTRDRSGRVVAVEPGDGPRITVERDALGRLTAVDEGGERVELRWDGAGRLTGRRRGGLELGWAYDLDGNRTAIVFPDGARTEFRFDGSGLAEQIRTSGGERIALERDAAGRLTRAGTARWEYADGDLVRHDAATFTRDASGRVTEVAEGGRVRRYSYDAAGQLRTAGGVTYDYDRNGRLVREHGPAGEVTYRYDAAGQLLSRAAGDAVTHYRYDEDGRRIAAGDVRYQWDTLGRLTSAGATPVRVDPLGELAEVGGTPLLWDSSDPLTPLCRIGDRPAPPFGSADPPGRDPWGDPAAAGPSAGFRGELEFEGLVWLRDRVYVPRDRCFLQPDPLLPLPGTAWAANPYHYAGNDPVNLADPLGQRPVTDQELSAYRDEMASGNWEYLVAGAAVVVGVGLMFTGVGGPAGIALMAASGGLIAGGVSAGMQKYSTGTVDWGQVGKDALVGAVSGAAGGAAGMVVGKGAFLATAPAPVRGALAGTVSGGISGMVTRGATGGNPFDPRGLATDLLIGAGAGAVGGRLGAGRAPAADPPPVPPGFRRIGGVLVPERPILNPPETGVPPVLYRGGGTSPSNLRLRPGEEALSFRDSLSNPLPPARPVFTKDEYVTVDTRNLPPEKVVPDGVPGSETTPPGHVSVYVDDPQMLKDAATKHKFSKDFP